MFLMKNLGKERQRIFAQVGQLCILQKRKKKCRIIHPFYLNVEDSLFDLFKLLLTEHGGVQNEPIKFKFWYWLLTNI